MCVIAHHLMRRRVCPLILIHDLDEQLHTFKVAIQRRDAQLCDAMIWCKVQLRTHTHTIRESAHTCRTQPHAYFYIY